MIDPRHLRPALVWTVCLASAVLSVGLLVAVPVFAWAQDAAATIDSPADAIKSVLHVVSNWKTVGFLGALVVLSQVGLWALKTQPWLRGALEKRGVLTVAGGLLGAIGAAGLAWTAKQYERIPEAAASGFVMGATWAYKPAEKTPAATATEIIAARANLPAGTKPGPV